MEEPKAWSPKMRTMLLGEIWWVAFEGLDGAGEVDRGEHGVEADEGDVRGYEEDGAGGGDGEDGGEESAARIEEPGDGRADEEGDEGERGGEAQGGEGVAGEVEEVRHGEGVVADVAMGEEFADVGDEGEMAGGPEAVGEGCGDGEAEGGVGGEGEGEGAAEGGVEGVAFDGGEGRG